MGQSNFESEKMLDIYIYNYLLKRNLQATAKSFMSEAEVSTRPVAIDVPRGFLLEWWSVFWDIFIARTNNRHSEDASTYIQVQQMKVKDLQMQQCPLMPQKHHQFQQSSGGRLARNGRQKNSISLELGSSSQLFDVGMGLLKAKNNIPRSPLCDIIGNPPQALQAQPQQTRGIDQLSRDLTVQGQRPLSAELFPHFSPRHQALPQVHALGNLCNPSIDGETDYGSIGALNGKCGNFTASPLQSCSPRVLTQDNEHRMKEHQMQKFTQKLPDQQEQQLQPNNRKRKQPTVPTNDARIDNIGLCSSPALTSVLKTSNEVAIAGDFSSASHTFKDMRMNGPDGMEKLAFPLNNLDDLEHLTADGFLVENVETFLSPNGENGTELFATLKTGSSDQSFSFSEAGCFQTSSKKVISCNFSSDGKFLASAGHEKKVVLWEMGSLKHWSSKEEHSSIITDICFRPGTMQLATSSSDATVRLWDAASEICNLHSFRGHNSRITSLDFHPNKTDVLCSCDVNGQILFWSCTAPYGCSRISKDATDTISKVRFQPKFGQFLAAASENAVAIHDIETDKKITTIPGHDNVLQSICWHDNGDYIAGVSQDCATVWSTSSGKCIHQFSSKGNQFRSCVFHPIYKNLLIIGGYQTLQLWNMAEQRIVDIQAHADLIVDLARSTEGLIGSVSHDFSVKIWR